MDKKGENKLVAWLIIIALGVFIWQTGFFQGFLGGAGGVTTGGTTPVRVEIAGSSACNLDGVVMTIGPGFDKYAPTTKSTTTYHRVQVNDIDMGNKLDGATMTVSPGDEITVTYALNDTITYMASRGEKFEVPCKPAISTADARFGNAAALVANTSAPTITIFNSDGDKMTAGIGAGGVNQSISAGQTKNLKLRFEGVNNLGWSAPVNEKVVDDNGNAVIGYGILTCNYQNNMVASLTLSDTLGDGATPVQHTVNNNSYLAKSFKITPFADNDVVERYLTVEAHASNDEMHVVNCSMYDGGWYQDTVTGKILYGVENNVAADVEGTNHKFGIIFD